MTQLPTTEIDPRAVEYWANWHEKHKRESDVIQLQVDVLEDLRSDYITRLQTLNGSSDYAVACRDFIRSLERKIDELLDQDPLN